MTKLTIVQVLLAQDVKKHCLEQDTYTNKHALKQRNNFSLKKNQWFKKCFGQSGCPKNKSYYTASSRSFAYISPSRSGNLQKSVVYLKVIKFIHSFRPFL